MISKYGSPASPGSVRLMSCFRYLVVCVGLTALMTGCQADETAEAEPTVAPTGGAAPLDAAAQLRQTELVTELQAIDQALMPIRVRAQENAEMQAAEQALVSQIDAAMESITPGILADRDRFEALLPDFQAAQQAGDQTRVSELGPELQGLQMRLEQAQTQAMEREDVTEAIATFREGLFEWMRGEDAQADSLLDRADEITAELESMSPPSGD